MRNRIIITFLLLFNVICFSQDFYKVKVNQLEVGEYFNDTTVEWSDSVLMNLNKIMIYKDSLVVNDGVCEKVYMLFSQMESNPGVKRSKALDWNKKMNCIVTYFSSTCLDNVSFTVIVDFEKYSLNYHGEIEQKDD